MPPAQQGRGRGLNEGPEVLQQAGRTFVTYSCAASWLPTYKLGMLELTGDDPLDPASWSKFPQPVFQSTNETYGVGHSCFVRSPDNSQWWHAFHAKRDRNPGWRRAIFVQPMQFTPQGLPEFGEPIAAGVKLPVPSGQQPNAAQQLPLSLPLQGERGDVFPHSVFAHHQFVAFRTDGLHLGEVPAEPINDYRCGEKLVLDVQVPVDLRASVDIDFDDNRNATDAGILFRVSQPAVGYDAQRGYFVGLIPKTSLLVIGKTDGQAWQELSRANVEIDVHRRQRLRIDIRGHTFTAYHNGQRVLAASDKRYGEGSVGLRVVNSKAIFSGLQLSPLAD